MNTLKKQIHQFIYEDKPIHWLKTLYFNKIHKLFTFP
jgi:hypothetical protein